MALRTRRRLILAKREDTEGVESIHPGDDSTAQSLQAAQAIAVFDVTTTSERQILDEQILTGSLGNRTKPVGRGSRGTAFAAWLRGSGNPDVPPDWATLMTACGVQEQRGRQATVDLVTPNQVYQAAEQIHGEILLLNTQWFDRQLDDPSTQSATPPAVGWTFTAYQTNRERPSAEGVILFVSGSKLVVRVNFGTEGVLRKLDHIRAVEPGVGTVRFNMSNAEQAVAVVLEAENGAAQSTLRYALLSGVDFANGEEIVGSVHGVRATLAGAPSDVGFVYRPDSRRTIRIPFGKFNVDPGGATQCFGPQEGNEIIKFRDASAWVAMGSVVSVERNREAITIAASAGAGLPTAITLNGHGVPAGTFTRFQFVGADVTGGVDELENGVDYLAFHVDPNTLHVFKITFAPLDTTGSTVNASGEMESSFLGGTMDVNIHYQAEPFALNDEIHVSTWDAIGVLNCRGLVTGKPVASHSPSVTWWDMLDGFTRKGHAQRGTGVIELVAGEIGKVRYTFQGRTGTEEGRLQLERVPLPATPPARWTKPGYGEMLGIRLRTTRAQLDLGNQVVPEPDANEDDGTAAYMISSRRPTLQVTAERAGHTGWQFENAVDGATWRTFAARLGSASGNTVIVACPRLQLTQVADAEENGILMVQITADVHEIRGDDDWFLFVR